MGGLRLEQVVVLDGDPGRLGAEHRDQIGEGNPRPTHHHLGRTVVARLHQRDLATVGDVELHQRINLLHLIVGAPSSGIHHHLPAMSASSTLPRASVRSARTVALAGSVTSSTSFLPLPSVL